MNDFVFDAIDAMQKNGYGDSGNFNRFVGRCCEHKSDGRIGFVVMTKEPLWTDIKKEITDILGRECPRIRIVSIEQNSNLFFTGDLFVHIKEV